MDFTRDSSKDVKSRKDVPFGGVFLHLYPLGWHTLPSHANAEAWLTGWPNAQPQGRDCVVLRDIIRLT